MQVPWISRTLVILAAAAAHAPSFAAQCAKDSPPHTVALLELYTSEGCDSCPPADRWLSGLAREATGAERVVPLALHVDYWDRIGWPARFASPDFGERQRALASRGGSRVVYTPGVFLNLNEFRNWSSATRLRQSLAAINAKPARADIRLSLGPPSDSQLAVRARFTLKPGASKPEAFIAVYENGLSTDVKAGENRGVTLRHDYVVREWIGPLDPSSEFNRSLALGRDWKPANLGVAAFIQDSATGEVLQAIALASCIKEGIMKTR